VVFLTNHLEFGATTIAAVYKDRWQIELLFKALKQHLKIKTFVGTSATALHTQIWTGLIALLVLTYLQLRSTLGWSLSSLVALLQFQLFTHRDLWAWLNAPFTGPPTIEPAEQLVLTAAAVNVTFGPLTCIPAAPTVAHSSSQSQWVKAGTHSGSRAGFRFI